LNLVLDITLLCLYGRFPEPEFRELRLIFSKAGLVVLEQSLQALDQGLAGFQALRDGALGLF
jgi:hypothetical protein